MVSRWWLGRRWCEGAQRPGRWWEDQTRFCSTAVGWSGGGSGSGSGGSRDVAWLFLSRVLQGCACRLTAPSLRRWGTRAGWSGGVDCTRPAIIMVTRPATLCRTRRRCEGHVLDRSTAVSLLLLLLYSLGLTSWAACTHRQSTRCGKVSRVQARRWKQDFCPASQSSLRAHLLLHCMYTCAGDV